VVTAGLNSTGKGAKKRRGGIVVEDDDEAEVPESDNEDVYDDAQGGDFADISTHRPLMD
jgi:hypothetical protein